jgi:hypothetical protein
MVCRVLSSSLPSGIVPVQDFRVVQVDGMPAQPLPVGWCGATVGTRKSRQSSVDIRPVSFLQSNNRAFKMHCLVLYQL